MFKPAEQRMKQYREVILGRFDGSSPFVQSLPALSPSPGSTPDPVIANGTWNMTTDRADLSWTPSPNANLDRYSIRACVGRTYRTVSEVIVADVARTVTAYATNFGLTALDNAVVFRVYVVTASGNERGSNDVPVTNLG